MKMQENKLTTSHKYALISVLDDSDVNFHHKKKKVFKPPQFDGCVSLENDVGPSYSFGLVNMGVYYFMEMLFGGNLFIDKGIRDPTGAELVPNPPSCPSLL
ncbi:hypothetical protein ACFX1X_025004 [Malus domestica]